MCGDICTGTNSNCTCGNDLLTYADHLHFCCLPPGEQCIRDENFNTVCSSGQTVHKSQACHGLCHDDAVTVQEMPLTCDYTHQCLTVSGPDTGSPCIFPFILGIEYTSCATWQWGGDYEGQEFCATKVTYNISLLLKGPTVEVFYAG